MRAHLRALPTVSFVTASKIVRSECESALAELKTAIPTLLISNVDEHHHAVAGATLTLDGLGVAIDGSPLEVDPGPHELAAAGEALNTTTRVRLRWME
jgi:hypothetical protein